MSSGENKRLHIQMIEHVIDRMASNSFLIRGWSLTILSGFSAIYVTSIKKSISFWILIIAMFFWILFWICDAFYLREERSFRDIYNVVIEKDENNIDFSMKPVKDKEQLFSCMMRPIYLYSYCPILIILVIVILVRLFC